MYPEDLLDRPASLFWVALWRDLRNAQADRQRREVESLYGR